MLVCSQCHHQNPDTYDQCEACFAPLDSTPACPNCGCSCLPETKFCGQCGMNLQFLLLDDQPSAVDVKVSEFPELSPPEPVIDLHLSWLAQGPLTRDLPGTQTNIQINPASAALSAERHHASEPAHQLDRSSPLKGFLVHCETQFKIDLEADASPIRLGKPNPQVMPDINLASFHHSEVVSRIHADILWDRRKFWIQDSGSANGTYVNGEKLKPGRPHTLASGDKISLGKGDLVTFTFELF